MKLRAVIFALGIAVFTLTPSKAQILQHNFYGEVGGMGFIAVSVNSQVAVYPFPSSKFFACAKIGIGHTLPPWDGEMAFISPGFEFGYGRKHAIGIGMEYARFYASPIYESLTDMPAYPDFRDMIYPRISYSIRSDSGMFYRFSLGVIGPIDHGWSDPIPFIGIGIGF